MHHMLGKFKVDLEAWKKGIEGDRAAHEQAGLHFKQAWKNADDPQEIYFLFEIDELERARVFLEKAGALDREKAARGEIPLLVFLAPG